jgi:hypothetical protein
MAIANWSCDGPEVPSGTLTGGLWAGSTKITGRLLGRTGRAVPDRCYDPAR